MQLYLLRHAIAAERDLQRYPRDFDRPLTREGRARMRRAAKGMRAIGLRFDVVLTSPLVRARQTARIVAAAFKPAPPVRIHRPLASGGTTQEVIGKLAGARRRVLLVGHEPDLSRLASELLLMSRTPIPFDFRKGGLCRIDFESRAQVGAGRLVFHLTPKLLRVLGA